jgi:hypothetical protein
MTLIQARKEKGYSLNNDQQKLFCRLQNDYNWIISHRKQLRLDFPDRYVAVENQSVRFTGDTIEALIAEITKNNEPVDNFAIEYISEHPTSLLF